MEKLLVIDDDEQILDSFRYAFPNGEYELHTATTAEAGLNEFRRNTFDVVITDIRLPDSSGLQLLDSMHELDARIPVILMTGTGNSNTAIEAIRRGAYHYVIKPLDLEEVQSVVARACEASRKMRIPIVLPIAVDTETNDCDLLVGNCPAMQDVYRQIGRAAGQNVTVLILGESGTGKEVVARAIYHYSKRAHRPYLAINCAAIPENLLESELFGHERGSFTGAEKMRVGKFEQCDGGTLFLDEIGDMTPLTQTKVLRVLQDQQFERVGGTELVSTNVRLIAATNRDLAQMMTTGAFRSDLYYRLNVYTIQLPPLRERTSDLPLLVKHFVQRFRLELDKNIQSVSPEVTRILSNYAWPGNIRELQSVLKHAIVEATGPVILPEFLPEMVRDSAEQHVPNPSGSITPYHLMNGRLNQFIRQKIASGTKVLYRDVMEPIERKLLIDLMHEVEGNVSRAAVFLGISRSTLRAKLVEYGINLDRTVHMTS
jgi:DNA-binding NtrC family response regulator